MTIKGIIDKINGMIGESSTERNLESHACLAQHIYDEYIRIGKSQDNLENLVKNATHIRLRAGDRIKISSAEIISVGGIYYILYTQSIDTESIYHTPITEVIQYKSDKN